MTLYLDTSLLVSALTNEERSAQVRDWLAAQAGDSPAISDWTAAEFSAALSVKMRMGRIDEAQRAAVLATFAELSEVSFERLSFDVRYFAVAAALADRYRLGLRAGDALHLAIARSHGARIASLDRKLIEAALALGVEAISP